MPAPAFRSILLLGLLDAFGPLGIDMYLPAFPRIARDMHARGGAMRWTLSLFLAGLAVGQRACGPIADRVGRRRPLLWGSAACAVASAACAFARSIETLILARFVMGLAGASGMASARAVVRGTFEEAESARVSSMLMLIIGIAPILSPSIGGRLMGLAGWGAIFRALAAFAGLCGLFVLVDLPGTPPTERRDREPALAILPGYAATIVDRRSLAYAAPSGLAPGSIFAHVASAPRLFMEHHRPSPGGFSLAFAGIAVGLIGAAQVDRWLTRRHATHAILRAAAVANASAGSRRPTRRSSPAWRPSA